MIPSGILQSVAARMRDITGAAGPKPVDLPALSFTDWLDVEQIARAVIRLKSRGWDRP